MSQFVKDEFEAFLECDILSYGFLRVRCAECGHEKLVAFSCKLRGICPSCGGRRMAETAAWLVDHVIPSPSFSVLGLPQIEAEQRSALEHLCRYITRPAIANERLSVNRAGQVVLKLKTPYRDGTSHLVMSPLEFMQRLAALVPRPRLHLIRFHGVLAPHAKLRAAIVPIPAPRAHAADCDHVHGARARMSWARLLKRVFDVDVERCGQCSGKIRIIAAIEESAMIERILTHLGLSAQSPPRAPARRVELFQAA